MRLSSHWPCTALVPTYFGRLALPPYVPAAACSHAFCLPCLREYISGKVADRAFPVPCPLPDCKQPISAAECGLVLTAEEMAALGQVGGPGLLGTWVLTQGHAGAALASWPSMSGAARAEGQALLWPARRQRSGGRGAWHSRSPLAGRHDAVNTSCRPCCCPIASHEHAGHPTKPIEPLYVSLWCSAGADGGRGCGGGGRAAVLPQPTVLAAAGGR